MTYYLKRQQKNRVHNKRVPLSVNIMLRYVK